MYTVIIGYVLSRIGLVCIYYRETVNHDNRECIRYCLKQNSYLYFANQIVFHILEKTTIDSKIYKHIYNLALDCEMEKMSDYFIGK